MFLLKQSKKNKRKKSKKEPFWKKLDPELQSIATHIGHIVDNSNIKDITDLAILIACAYGGYNVWSKVHPDLGIGGAITGAVGYKLATTEGGTPPASQIAGLGILGSTVLVGANIPGWWNELPQEEKEKVINKVYQGPAEFPYGIAGLLTIPTGDVSDAFFAAFGIAGTGLRVLLEQMGVIP